MPPLSKVLRKLEHFCLLRDQRGVVRPACLWIETDGENDPERYQRAQGPRVRILRLVGKMAEEPAAFEEVLEQSHLSKVVHRLSEESRVKLARGIEHVCAFAATLAAQMRPYVKWVPIEHMQIAAVQGLYALLLAEGDRLPELPDDRMRDYLRRQIQQAARDAHGAQLRSAKRLLASARSRAKYAEGKIISWHEAAKPLRPSVHGLEPLEVRRRAGALAESIHETAELLEKDGRG